MTNQILIDVQNSITSVALVADGTLIEYYIEAQKAPPTTGNIYKGKVVNVLEGMQSAFVDIGLNRNGFLYVGESIADTADLEASALPNALTSNVGDYVLVQATKEETGSKGTRLTQNISLPGRLVVYMPNMEFTGVSSKIACEKTRLELVKILRKQCDKDGVIARTAAAFAKKTEIIFELENLKNTYKNILHNYINAQQVGLLHSEGDLIVRAVRDMCSVNTTSIVCNDKATLDSIKAHLGALNLNPQTILYDPTYDILDKFGILHQIEKLLERKVNLENGGHIIIDYTEALTVIDVNSGGYIGQDNHETAALAINIAAATEIAKQLRLRNIGGMIVVDFIDLILPENRVKLENHFLNCLAVDRTKTRCLPMNEFGLISLTRKKVRNDLASMLLEKCPYCNGDSHTQSAAYVARKIRAKLLEVFNVTENNTNAIILLNPHTLNKIYTSRFLSNDAETFFSDKRIYLVPDDKMPTKQFKVVVSSSSVLTLPQSAKLLF